MIIRKKHAGFETLRAFAFEILNLRSGQVKPFDEAHGIGVDLQRGNFGLGENIILEDELERVLQLRNAHNAERTVDDGLVLRNGGETADAFAERLVFSLERIVKIRTKGLCRVPDSGDSTAVSRCVAYGGRRLTEPNASFWRVCSRTNFPVQSQSASASRSSYAASVICGGHSEDA